MARTVTRRSVLFALHAQVGRWFDPQCVPGPCMRTHGIGSLKKGQVVLKQFLELTGTVFWNSFLK